MRAPADGSRLGDMGSEGGSALGASPTSVRHGCGGRGRTRRRKAASGAPLPGAPNVGVGVKTGGSRVPAKPLRFKHCGAHEDLPLPTHALNLSMISKLSLTNSQHRGHEIYTGAGHHCGVIPYSSVWCGALPLGLMRNSTMEEQPREGLFLAGAMNC